MAFPVIATVSSNTTASSTSHTVTLPTGIVSGDLIVVMFAEVSNDTTTSWPAGWTELFDVNGLSTAGHAAAYRRSDGGEGASITVTTGLAVTGAYVAYRITGHHATSDPEAGTAAVGESANPNPPTLTASWGAEDNLWIATWGGQASTTTAYPTNYGIAQTQVSGCAAAARELNATSDDPGTFTQGNTVWVANTIAIRPAAGGAAFIARQGLHLGQAVNRSNTF